MANSFEGGMPKPEASQEKTEIPFIRVDMGKAKPEDYEILEKLGWTIGPGSAGGDKVCLWEGAGEPVLPDELAKRIVIGTTKGPFEIAYRVKKDKK
jgi:hypothetical protein